ncbi:VanZ family protein [Paenibacillus sp. LHD-38]|uniref:VanZ family protein n=1 Tax=Paenibacillus sp. LHD-38 TaxID=3072143 RepID=UPI00280C77D7|nr:VanZ family protein [Paenibacillus sp. LHD-38]MDQ8739007.1 VanZ family protein [Paenibacillus sp. LHD-38]
MAVTINPYHRLFQVLLWVVAVIYSIVVFKILFIGTISRLMYGEFRNYGVTYTFSEKFGGSLNIVPFRSILEYLIHHNNYNLDIIFNNLIGNILLFVPFGLLLPLLAKKTLTLSRVIFISVLVTVLLEVIQKISSLGVADIDEVLLHTVGSMTGFGFYQFINMGWNAWRIKQYERKQIRL